MGQGNRRSLELFSTCPPSWAVPRDDYLRRVADIARWSDEAGYRGILVYTDNSLVDPWLVSNVILDNTASLCPLVAVQPMYMHPYAVAKMVTTFGYLRGRRIFLNMVAGGFVGDLLALGDTTEHDARYDRLTEYTQIVKDLLSSSGPVTFRGEYYEVENLRLQPALAAELFPGITVSGSSEAGLQAARTLGATAIKYPQPPGEELDRRGDSIQSGVRVGIVARGSGDEAWAVALERFPEDRKGQITHALAMSVSDSKWHAGLSELGESPVSDVNPYWLGPFRNYKTFCPYLVGSYDLVGRELARYIALGFETFILDVPASHEELEHISIAFSKAWEQLGELPSDERAAEPAIGTSTIVERAEPSVATD